MRYVHFHTGQSSPPTRGQRLAMRYLSTVLPVANPDFEEAYDRVTDWWLEVDDAGQVQREVGLDAAGAPAAAAPLGRNVGVFTDQAGAPEPLGAALDPAAFEAAWMAVATRLGLLHDDRLEPRTVAGPRPPRWRRALHFGVRASSTVTLLGLVAWAVPGVGGHGLFPLLYLLGAWPSALLMFRPPLLGWPYGLICAAVFVAQVGWYTALALPVFWLTDGVREPADHPPTA
jgi:hypothetical protein